MIHVGMCSWAEKTLIKSGEFYPKGMNTAEKRLRYYAGVFNVVEVDSSYYGIPAEKTVSQWAERTPTDFIFHIKAFALLTGHSADLSSIPPEVRDMLPSGILKKGRVAVREREPLEAAFRVFREAMRPLKEAGKLGIAVFQYPQQFVCRSLNLDYILFCRDAMGDIPIGVEFRNGSWLTPDRAGTVFTFLREHGITYIAVDEPQYSNLSTVPFIPEVTTDIAYFRLHGRNRENWLKKGIETSLRYDYSYSDDELKEFVPSILQVSGKAMETFVMFNNHGSPAINNAVKLRQMIGEKAP
jgi:uncharacterized protein YecE (DUF72 family)